MRYAPALLLGWVMTFASVTADTAPSVALIVSIHTAAIGGRERIAALKAFKASGHVTVEGKDVPFTVIAARPNRLRMQYEFEDGKLDQGTDGSNPPWEHDGRTHPPRNRLMSAADAEAFLASADFDDPLLAATEHGDAIEYAGNTTVSGRPMIRLLITQHLTKGFFLLLDAETYLIASRVDPRPAAGNDRMEVVTEYRDYRPVGGVLAAFTVNVWTNGRLSERATLIRAEANPTLPAGIFSAPAP